MRRAGLFFSFAIRPRNVIWTRRSRALCRPPALGRAHLGRAAPPIYPSVSFRQGQVHLSVDDMTHLGTTGPNSEFQPVEKIPVLGRPPALAPPRWLHRRDGTRMAAGALPSRRHGSRQAGGVPDGEKVLSAYFLDSPLCFRLNTPRIEIQASNCLSESCPKIGDVPKSPFATVAALVPSAGTITPK
jgi:hypothetical protein